MREVPLEEIDGVRKEKERLTAAWLSMSTENDTDGDSLSIS